MNDRIPELIILLSLATVFFAWRWWTIWRVGQLHKRLLQSLIDSQQHPSRLDLERKHIVRVSDDSISCERPDGTIEQVAWADLQRVDFRTTSDGPLLPCQFLVLTGSASSFVIPCGATGADAMTDRLQKLPHFDNNAVIEAASKTGESVQTCWRRKER